MIDLIANLYKEKERNNGFGSGSDMNWANLNGNGLHVNGVNKDEMNSKGLDLDLKENGLNSDITESDLVKKDKNWNGNGVDLGLVNGNEPFAFNGGGGGGDDNDDDDDDGWEFKGAVTKTDVEVEISKATEMKAVNGLVSNVNGLNSRWNPLSLDLNGWTSHVNRDDSSWEWLNMGKVDGDTALGNSDGWEFKETGSRIQVEDEKEKGEQLKAEIKPILSFDGSISTWNSLSFDGSNSTWNSLSLDGLKNSNLNEVTSDRKQMNLNSPDENEDFGGNDEWEFKAAESESGTGDKDTKGVERKVENPEGTTHALGFGSGVLGAAPLSLKTTTCPIHTLKMSRMVPKKSRFPPLDDGVDSDEESWEFKDAFSETRSKEKEEPKVVEVSAAVEAFPFDGEIKGSMARSISHKGALPLSIFGDEEQDSNDPVSDQDISPQLQAEHDTAVNLCQNPSGSGLSPANVVIESNLAGNSDDFDDESWEFKDASSVIRAEDQASFIGLGEPNTKYSTKIELNDCVDFFCKLKEELHFLALCHLDNLKKAQGAASDDAEVKALGKEVQKIFSFTLRTGNKSVSGKFLEILALNLHDELQQDGLFSGEVDTGNHSPRKLCLDEFVEVLQEPKFQVFESEYQLTSKLSLVENDLRLTMELHKHVASTIKILTLSLQKDVHDQILSKPQGKNYIVALGEIYRVVEVIGSSARLYKPWLLVSSTNPMCLLTLLSECFTIWSSSGLEEALQSISDPAGLDYNGGLTTLIESIKYIHNLDTLTLYNHVFGGQGPICQLSVLTAGTVPGMKTVVWNGEHYFLTLANLWANLVSCNPSKFATHTCWMMRA
ncbi:hypothetical protein OIU79_023494 [Salix purpurea]|uniref:Synergin gamma C-terminal domain-containing protein n=1 Tax=Salix purpurea TaxID=77065 RepID=A0A9Q1A918_SALPP|nr:hypothetical protein OIU79_023494 [Salix purpurea]